MVTLQRYDFAAKKLGEVQFDETVFGDRARVRCLRAASLMYAANRRQGTADTKERSEVAGTTKKPWKQKHTGRARAGSKKSPIWRGGGTIFGPHPRDYSYARPAKELRVALRGALYGKLADKEVGIVANLSAVEPGAKPMRPMLAAFGKGNGTASSCLVVLGAHDPKLWLSMRNFPKVEVCTSADLNAEAVLRNRLVLLTEEAANQLKGGARNIAVTGAKKPAQKASKKAAAAATA